MQNHPRKAIKNPLPVPELLARAAGGDTDCQYWVGLRYFQADGLPEDPAEALRWCKSAAEQGHAPAQAFVAYCYAKGLAVPKDLRTGVRWYRPSARQGYAPAQFSLGVFYLCGRGVKQNIRLGLKWLDKAAAQDHVEALVKLGDIHRHTREVVPDDEKACRYYRRAAELGSPEGQFKYGNMLFNGFGTSRDPLQALELLDQAAGQGYESAVSMREQFEAFVSFDPAGSALEGISVGHPFPLRQRTVVTMMCLERPCYQAMVRDLYDYARQHPKNSEVALKDIAALLTAAADQGEAPTVYLG